MSWESADRLWRRPSAALFAAAWDRAMDISKSQRPAKPRFTRKPCQTLGFPRFSMKVTKWKMPCFTPATAKIVTFTRSKHAAGRKVGSNTYIQWQDRNRGR